MQNPSLEIRERTQEAMENTVWMMIKQNRNIVEINKSGCLKP